MYLLTHSQCFFNNMLSYGTVVGSQWVSLITKYIKIASSSLISWSNNFLHLKNSNKIFLNDKKFLVRAFLCVGGHFPRSVYIIETYPH